MQSPVPVSDRKPVPDVVLKESSRDGRKIKTN